MPRACPDCRTDLRSEEILGICLDVCPQCAGIWFDDGELLKLKELGDVAIEEVEDEIVPDKKDGAHTKASKRMCPDCGAGMEEFSYIYASQVKLDSCGNCYGTWIHEGELTAMRRALEDSRMQAENPQLMRAIEHQLVALDLEEKHKQFLDRHRTVTRVMRTFMFRRPSIS